MEKIKKIQTVLVVHQHPQVLLGMKKRGFGAGRWNGFGGKQEPGETVEQTARREMLEEVGVEVEDAHEVGSLIFEFDAKPDEQIEVHFFKSTNFRGEPTESEEMKPGWFEVENIPFGQMWPDDKFWMPLLLQDKKFTGRFLFGEGDKILEMDFQEI